MPDVDEAEAARNSPHRLQLLSVVKVGPCTYELTTDSDRWGRLTQTVLILDPGPECPVSDPTRPDAVDELRRYLDERIEDGSVSPKAGVHLRDRIEWVAEEVRRLRAELAEARRESIGSSSKSKHCGEGG